MARDMRIRVNPTKRALLAGIDKAIDELIDAGHNLQNGNRNGFFDSLRDAVNMVILLEIAARGMQVDDLEEPTDEYGFVKED